MIDVIMKIFINKVCVSFCDNVIVDLVLFLNIMMNKK